MKTAARRNYAVLLLACALALPATAAAQQNPFSTHTKWMYAGLKFMLLRSAEKMPEENYGFKPTEAVRSFGQIIGHTADSQYRFCAMAAGQPNPAPAIEKNKTSKAELVAALKESFAFCDRVYDSMTDSAALEVVKFDGSAMPRLGVLNVNNLHDSEHYGNLITYLRLKNIVPPSSEPGFNVPAPKK